MISLYDIKMRTLIDITNEQVKALKEFCAKESISRAEAIRRAIDEFLSAKLPLNDNRAFGLWKNKKIDGLKYQQRLRSEWDSR